MSTSTDIFVAERQADGTFGNARPVNSLNSDAGDQRPSIRYDGLEIFFFSTRVAKTSNGRQDIWVATRNDVRDDWGAPVDLGAVVNSEYGDFNPYISGDGQSLYFTSDRPSSCGKFNIYETTRSRPNPPHDRAHA
jgi:Tol biopolymer transport system component